MQDYWEKSKEYWKESGEWWSDYMEKYHAKSQRPVHVTEDREQITITDKCLCGCGQDIEQPETGRKRVFASDSCRVRYNRSARKCKQ